MSAAGTVGPSRRPSGPSLGPVPLACLVVVEVGLAAAVVLVALDRSLLPVAGVVLSLALLLGLLRVRRRWIGHWIGLAVRFQVRGRARDAEARGPDDDPRLGRLRLLVGDMTLAHRRDHDGREVGLVGHGGSWSAMLGLDPGATAGAGALVGDAGGPDPAASFPLGALAGCLADRGVVLDAVSAIWHCRPGGADLAEDAPALEAYREVLGPLPPLARREAWLVVRLDPTRCPQAIAERGGGVVGAHRAVVGALARIGRVLADHGVAVRPMDAEEVVTAGVVAADLDPPPSAEHLQEHWGAVVVGDVGHACFGVTSWPAAPAPLDALTGVEARSCTLALTLEPDGDPGGRAVGLRGTVRLTAATPDDLQAAGDELVGCAAGLGVVLDPLDGQHAAGIAATLPLGTAP